MPIRAVVSPKFTYSQGHQEFKIRRSPLTTDVSKNGMLDYSGVADLTPYVLMPDISWPLIGNGHSARRNNRITISSVRVKLSFHINTEFLTNIAIWGSSATAGSNFPANNNLFAKFRLFLMSFDDDIVMTPAKFLNWFYSTYCMYRDPTVTEVLKGPSETAVTTTPAPTSVHSNVLRTTTEWTGKFNILADRRFTLSSKKTEFDVDMTVPLRKEFVFDEVYDITSKLLYPKLYLFILPPLSFETDIDTYSSHFAKTTNSTTALEKKIADVYYWSKLNFVDL